MPRTRDEIQQKALRLYLESGLLWAVIELGTGVGKSKIAVDLIKELRPGSVLILVNSERLRDVDWPETLKKFGLDEEQKEKVDIMCYQSAYTRSDLAYELVIADELDYALTEKYSQTFTANEKGLERVLGLTATLSEEKRERCAEVFGQDCLLYSYSTQQAQQERILNDSRFVFARFFLSQHPQSCSVGKGERIFYFSENERYLFLEQRYQDALRDYEINRISGTESQIKRSYKAYRYHRDQRAAFLHTLKSSAYVARQLTRKLLSEDTTNKVLVFSKRTKQIDAICKYTFHSKNKKNSKVVEKLDRGDIRALGVCGALNRGANLSGVNNIILESYDGSSTVFQQRHGRGTRLQVGDTLRMYFLIPCYVDREGREKYTQASEWVLRMTEDFNLQGRTESLRFDTKAMKPN
jgi:superfamily II DNA or RNA helicase